MKSARVEELALAAADEAAGSGNTRVFDSVLRKNELTFRLSDICAISVQDNAWCSLSAWQLPLLSHHEYCLPRSDTAYVPTFSWFAPKLEALNHKQTLALESMDVSAALRAWSTWSS